MPFSLVSILSYFFKQLNFYYIDYIGDMMNKIDYEFYSLIKKLELMSKEEVYLNIKNRYLSLNEELRNNIETFLNSFNYWGKLGYINNDFEEINNVVNFLKNNLTDLVVFYQNLKDYKSRKILLAILRNYYYYDFTMLNEVPDTCYKHYFDPDLVKTTKDTVFVDVGSYIGDSVDDFLDTYLEEYKKIYCYEVTKSSIAILKDKFIFNEDIIIKNKALYDKKTTLSLNASSVDNSANTINDNNGDIEAVSLDEDINEKIDIIKMDIEGAECKALEGAKKHIKNDSPTLLISIYHGFNDLIRIPKLIKSFNKNYNFYLRYYGGNVFPTEIVLVAKKKAC